MSAPHCVRLRSIGSKLSGPSVFGNAGGVSVLVPYKAFSCVQLGMQHSPLQGVVVGAEAFLDRLVVLPQARILRTRKTGDGSAKGTHLLHACRDVVSWGCTTAHAPGYSL
eukprot:scaffold14039_cov37-Tisochrysis_lutea.AAC.3